MRKVEKREASGKAASGLPGPAELARQRTVLIERAHVLDQMDVPANDLMEVDRKTVEQLAWDLASDLQVRICSTPATTLNEALAVAECMHGLISSLPPSGDDTFSKDRDRALEHGILILMDSLIEAGADEAAMSEMDAEHIRQHVDLLRFVNGGDR